MINYVLRSSLSNGIPYCFVLFLIIIKVFCSQRKTLLLLLCFFVRVFWFPYCHCFVSSSLILLLGFFLSRIPENASVDFDKIFRFYFYKICKKITSHFFWSSLPIPNCLGFFFFVNDFSQKYQERTFKFLGMVENVL